jgi:hypothetical protein
MSKQTAVEWLVNVVQSCIAPNFIPKEIVEQAKEMEKEKIEGAYNDGWMSCEKWFADKELDDYIGDANEMQEELNKQV